MSQRKNKAAEKTRGEKERDLSEEFQKAEDENLALHTPAGEMPDVNKPRAADEVMQKKEQEKKGAA